jgi:putative oxidoreductase
MKPEARIAQLLMASVFLVLGGYRLWQAMNGVPIANGTLVFSALEVVLGLALASGWRLRMVALLVAGLMVVDAAMSHAFWKSGGAQQAGQLLHFMKNVGLAGGLLLLSSVATGKRR